MPSTWDAGEPSAVDSPARLRCPVAMDDGAARRFFTRRAAAGLVTMLAVAARSKDPFAQLSCVGFAALIFTQVVVNIGMTLGLLPIIGITLPFLSYGGSSLLASFAMIGLTMNFASRPIAPLVRPSFEFDPTTEQLEPAA